MKKTFVALVFVLVAMLCLCAPTALASSPNLLLNGSFEKGQAPWVFQLNGGSGTLPTIVCGKGIAYKGNGKCVAELPADGTGSIISPPVKIVQSRMYTLSVWFHWLITPQPSSWLEAKVDWFDSKLVYIKSDYVFMIPPPCCWAEFFAQRIKSPKKAASMVIRFTVRDTTGDPGVFGVKVDKIKLVRR